MATRADATGMPMLALRVNPPLPFCMSTFTLELTVVGTLDGKPWSLSPLPAAQPVLIKSYLRQEGVIDVPPQAVIKTVTARILQGGAVRSVHTQDL